MLRPCIVALTLFVGASTSNPAAPSALLKQSDVPVLNAPDEGKVSRPIRCRQRIDDEPATRGRVRVRALAENGDSGPPSSWREFRFTR